MSTTTVTETAGLPQSSSADFIPEGGSFVAFRWFGTAARPTISLPEQIAARIGDQIVTGVIEPGAQITEQAIATAFQTSRGPVREALRILERERLVQILPRHGARASNLSRQDVHDLFEIRAWLYQAVAARLATAPTPRALRLLENGIEDLERHAAPQDDDGGYASTIFRLSLSCAREAGNPQLADMITSLALQAYRYSRLALHTRARRQHSAGLWRESLAAIRAGDVPRAQDLAARRILAARDEALRLLDGEPLPPP